MYGKVTMFYWNLSNILSRFCLHCFISFLFIATQWRQRVGGWALLKWCLSVYVCPFCFRKSFYICRQIFSKLCRVSAYCMYMKMCMCFGFFIRPIYDRVLASFHLEFPRKNACVRNFHQICLIFLFRTSSYSMKLWTWFWSFDSTFLFDRIVM